MLAPALHVEALVALLADSTTCLAASVLQSGHHGNIEQRNRKEKIGTLTEVEMLSTLLFSGR